MKTRTNRILACAGLVLAIAAFTPSAWANLLVDSGFEANPLETASNVLNDFPTYQGNWGVEAAAIVGVEGSVTPAEAVKMLRMVDDGLVTTQGFQVTDVTSYAALIDSGAGTVNLSALLNSHVSAAIGGVYVQFFSGPTYGSEIGSYISGGLTLDSLAGTWETASVSGAIPVNTRWLLSQVAYSNVSLHGDPGYVDAAKLTITPEPATFGLLALGGLFATRRRHA